MRIHDIKGNFATLKRNGGIVRLIEWNFSKLGCIVMYIKSIYKYLHDFIMPVESATIEIAIAIENGWSLKLRQTRQVVAFATASSPTRSTSNARPSGHYPTRSWVSGRDRSKERGVG
jgi:hypothetical protein